MNQLNSIIIEGEIVQYTKGYPFYRIVHTRREYVNGKAGKAYTFDIEVNGADSQHQGKVVLGVGKRVRVVGNLVGNELGGLAIKAQYTQCYPQKKQGDL